MTSETCQGRHPGCGKSQKEKIRGGPRRRDTEEEGKLEGWCKKKHQNIGIGRCSSTLQQQPALPRVRHLRTPAPGIEVVVEESLTLEELPEQPPQEPVVGRGPPLDKSGPTLTREQKNIEVCLPKRLSPTHKKDIEKK